MSARCPESSGGSALTQPGGRRLFAEEPAHAQVPVVGYVDIEEVASEVLQVRSGGPRVEHRAPGDLVSQNHAAAVGEVLRDQAEGDEVGPLLGWFEVYGGSTHPSTSLSVFVHNTAFPFGG